MCKIAHQTAVCQVIVNSATDVLHWFNKY